MSSKTKSSTATPSKTTSSTTKAPAAKKIKKILLVGGTHGNESTGVFLINKWNNHPELLARSEFQVDTLIANPAAVAENRRYIDKDLNRCFSSTVLTDQHLSGVEVERAHRLVEQLGGKGECQYDMIIDLHSSTANMKTNLVLTKNDSFHLTMMSYMQQTNDQVVVTSEAELIPDHHFLCALADHNLIVEVGPVPQGVMQHQAISASEQAVYQLLDFVELWNRQNLPELDDAVEVLSYIGKIHFPKNESGEVIGYLHPEVDGQDYSLLKSGDTLFVTFNDELVQYEGDPVYVSFVNEAAYYDQKIALCTLEKKRFSITSFSTTP